MERDPDRLRRIIDVRQEFSVPQPQYTISVLLEPKSPRRVVRDGVCIRVLPAIQFNDKPSLNADKIGNVVADGILASEFESAEAPTAKNVPQASLGVGVGLAECSRSVSMDVSPRSWHARRIAAQ